MITDLAECMAEDLESVARRLREGDNVDSVLNDLGELLDDWWERWEDDAEVEDDE